MKEAVRIAGLPKNTRKLFRRAIELAGAGSQSKWLFTQIRKLIREQQEKFGEDLLKVLTDQEKDVLGIVASGAAEIQQIAEESLIPEKQLMRILDDLIERGFIETKKKGRSMEGARGAAIILYWVTEKYKGPMG